MPGIHHLEKVERFSASDFANMHKAHARMQTAEHPCTKHLHACLPMSMHARSPSTRADTRAGLHGRCAACTDIRSSACGHFRLAKASSISANSHGNVL